MDPLSEVLKSVRLEGALYLDAEFTAPWCIRGCYGVASVQERLAGAEHIAFFHFVTEGQCKVRLVDGTEVHQVGAGDLVLFPRDDRHLMGSDLAVPPLETENFNATNPAAGRELVALRLGGGGPTTRFVCGYLACNRSVFRPLLDSLPRLLRIPVGDGRASAQVRGLLRMGVSESGAARPGSASALARLAELLFVEALRRYAESLPADGKGWLAAVRDRHVGRALSLLHADPKREWTLDELAREAALSRSALAGRFKALIGESPMQYLGRWRLALAARALRAGREPIGRIVERSGYASETAFIRAFKREFGVPPAAWRKGGSR
jgi:AraC-like DNA-binding protein